jgi:hypothetical protein
MKIKIRKRIKSKSKIKSRSWSGRPCCPVDSFSYSYSCS